MKYPSLRGPLVLAIIVVLGTFLVSFSIMHWTFYIFLFIFLGVLSWERILPKRNIIETILIGSLWGMILATVIPFIFGLFLSFDKGVLLSEFLSLITIGLLFWIGRNSWREKINQLKYFIQKEKNSLRILLIAFVVIAFIYLFLVSRIIFINQNNWYATGFRAAYGDASFHLMYISSFAFGNNFPPQNPDFAGTPSNYPFLPHILSAALIKLGANLITGFLAPVFILSFIIVALLIYVPWRVTGEVWTGVLVPIIFLLSGGLGFWWFFQAHGLNIFSSETKFLDVFRDELTNIPQYHINLMNVMLSSLLPQRGVLYGLPIFLSTILLWFNQTRRSILASAILVGSLPLLHTHTFVALMIVLPFLVTPLIVKKSLIFSWICFGIIVVFLALPAFMLLQPSDGFFQRDFIHFTRGWMANGDNIVWYWFKNLGLFLPLLVLALCLKVVPKNLKLWYLPFLSIFVVANLILFSPWEFDNHKFFNLWYLVSAFLISFFLVGLWKQRNLAIKIFVPIVLMFLIISGGIEVLRLWHFSKAGLQLFSPEAQQLAEFLKMNTRPDSVFLTSTSHLSPVNLSGRKHFLGFTGWLWSRGIKFAEREREVKLIYSGSPEAEILIEKEGITHILIGEEELREFPEINISFFEENYRKIYDSNNYKVFY